MSIHEFLPLKVFNIYYNYAAWHKEWVTFCVDNVGLCDYLYVVSCFFWFGLCVAQLWC